MSPVSTEDDLERESDDDEVDDPPPVPQPEHRGRPKSRRDRPQTLGAPGPPKFQRTSNFADEAWNELLEYGSANGFGARDVAIQVRRVFPPAPSGESVIIGRSFGGEVVQGTGQVPPGAMLHEHVLQFHHLATTENAASYDIHFMKKATGHQFMVARLGFPDGPACRMALDASDVAARRADSRPGPGYTPPGSGYGPPGPGYAPGQGYPVPWYAQPPPQQQSPQLATTLNELAYLRGVLKEATDATKENRRPNIPEPPQGFATSPVAPISEDALADKVTAKVLMALQGAGVMPKPVPEAAVIASVSAPAAQAVNTLSGRVEKMIGGILEGVIDQVGAQVGRSIKTSMGMGAPIVEAAAESDEIVPEAPEDTLPWKVAPVGSKYADGRDVLVARDHKTGDIDWTGTAMANPLFAEKAVEVVQVIGESVKRYVERIMGAQVQAQQVGAGQPNSGVAQVVHEIPKSTIQADVSPQTNGSAWQAP